MSKPLINGTRHSWGSIKTNLLGRTVSGISAVSYEDKQEKVNNYGAGNMPTSRGRGKYEATAKMTLDAYEVDAITRSVVASGQGTRIQDIAPFDVIVSYLPEGSDGLVTHVLRNCEFTSNKRDLKQGDTRIESEYELILSHIDWA
jgi:hypothetical protein